MREMISEPEFNQQVRRFFYRKVSLITRHEQLDCDIFSRGERWQQMELLKDKPKILAAEDDLLFGLQRRWGLPSPVMRAWVRSGRFFPSLAENLAVVAEKS